MPKCAPNELTKNTLYFIFSLLLPGVTINTKSQKWWMVLGPLLQSKVVKVRVDNVISA